MKWLRYGWILFLMIAIPGAAQEACSADVVRAFARAAAACRDVGRNEVCYGNGAVTGMFDDAYEGSFALVGERATTGLMQQLIVNSVDEFSVASMRLQLSLVDTQPGRNVSLIAFGDVTLTNQVPIRPAIPVESTGVLTVRSLPDIEADIIEQYPLRTTIIANGLHKEGKWLRVEVPDTSDIGWIALDLVTTTADIKTLNLVDVDTPFLRPFQLMSILTGADDAPCSGAPQSGVLIQSPNVIDPVSMTVNGVDLLLSGTLYVQSVPEQDLVLRQLEGHTFVQLNTQTQWLVSGGEVLIPLDSALTVSGDISAITPLDPNTLTGVPVNSLDYRVRIPDALTQDQLDSQIADLVALPVLIARIDEMHDQRCIGTANRRVTLYAGPGTFHEVIRIINPGSRIYPVLRLSDSAGVIWWQLSNSHWMLASQADSEGDCTDVPLTEVVDAPDYNVLVLETCDTSNGPIRAGQWVQIEFTIGSFRTLGEALQATQIDRGRVTINQQWVYVSADAPFEVAEERFYRKFYGNWYAESGTYRIVGSRLTYSVICDVTVPVG